MLGTGGRTVLGFCLALLLVGCANETKEPSTSDSQVHQDEHLSRLVSGTKRQQGPWNFVEAAHDPKTPSKNSSMAEIECSVEGQPVFTIVDAKGNTSFAGWKKSQSGSFLVSLSNYYNVDVPVVSLKASVDGHTATWPLKPVAEPYDWPEERVLSDKFEVLSIPVELVWLNAYVVQESEAYNGSDTSLAPLVELPNDGKEYRVQVATPFPGGAITPVFDLRNPKKVYLEPTGSASTVTIASVLSAAKGTEHSVKVTVPALSYGETGEAEAIKFEIAGRQLELVMLKTDSDNQLFTERNIQFEVRGNVKALLDKTIEDGDLILSVEDEAGLQQLRGNVDGGASFQLMSMSKDRFTEEYELKFKGLLVEEAEVKTVVFPVQDARKPTQSEGTP